MKELLGEILPFLSLGEGAIARFGVGLDILLFGWNIWVWKKLVVLPWVGARLFLFLCRKEISDEISLLGLSR